MLCCLQYETELSSMHVGRGGDPHRRGRRRLRHANQGTGSVALQHHTIGLHGQPQQGAAAGGDVSQSGMLVGTNPAMHPLSGNQIQASQQQAGTGPARHDSSLAMASAGLSTKSGTISGGAPEHSNTVSTANAMLHADIQQHDARSADIWIHTLHKPTPCR
jgi:hypothetical protein